MEYIVPLLFKFIQVFSVRPYGKAQMNFLA